MLEAGSGRVILLTSKISSDSDLDPGTPIAFANDLDIAADGTVYFSDSSAIPPARNSESPPSWDIFLGFLLTTMQVSHESDISV